MIDRGRAVLILGCGFTGTELAQRLAFSGRPVFGTTRSPARVSIIRTRGAQPIVFDGRDTTPLKQIRGRVGAVVDCIPPRSGDNDDDPTERLVEFFADEPIARFVYVSSTSVYGDKGGQRVTETTACTPDSPRGRRRLAAEERLLASRLPAVVVRAAGIYGPGRSFLHRLASGRTRLITDAEAYLNRIHVADLAALLEAAIDRGENGAIYLAADGTPATQRELVRFAVDSLGLPEPPHISSAEARIRYGQDGWRLLTSSKRLEPRWTLEQLGVALRYPDYRAGFADIRRQEPDLGEVAPAR